MTYLPLFTQLVCCTFISLFLLLSMHNKCLLMRFSWQAYLAYGTHNRVKSASILKVKNVYTNIPVLSVFFHQILLCVIVFSSFRQHTMWVDKASMRALYKAPSWEFGRTTQNRYVFLFKNLYTNHIHGCSCMYTEKAFMIVL